MNFSEKHWEKPELFQPSRFIRENNFKKPKHFQPFSLGKRQCMGYKIVEYVTVYILATVLKQFDVRCHQDMRDQPRGQLGLAPKPFYFSLRKLNQRDIEESRGLA